MDDLTALRIKAQAVVKSERWELILSLEDQLRTDPLWPLVWAPYCAIASAQRGDEKARTYLDEAIAGGFFQPELCVNHLFDAFQEHPDWPELLAKMEANMPAPPVELLSWPAPEPKLPLRLDQLAPDREQQLRTLLLDRAITPWLTACQLMTWIRARWTAGYYMNSHKFRLATQHAPADAVTLVETVPPGRIFRCNEYAMMLAQALNAQGIPTRRVDLSEDKYHCGSGRGHAATEAWIDDYQKWVLLDGQYATYWHEDNVPLNAAELQERYYAGADCPEFVQFHDGVRANSIRTVWPFFRNVRVTGYVFARTAFCPVFQDSAIIESDCLTADPHQTYPDLSAITVGTCEVDGRPGIRLHTPHPRVEGFAISNGEQTEQVYGNPAVFALPTDAAGEHTLSVQVRTEYGPIPRDNVITYRVARSRSVAR